LVRVRVRARARVRARVRVHTLPRPRDEDGVLARGVHCSIRSPSGCGTADYRLQTTGSRLWADADYLRAGPRMTV